MLIIVTNINYKTTRVNHRKWGIFRLTINGESSHRLW
jgi:hypothetical protein